MKNSSPKKTVLIVGGGGRETTLVYGYGKSPHVGKILVTPGNDLMQDVTKTPVSIFPDIKTVDVEKILQICKEHDVDLVDIAQDNAVAVGLGDELEKNSILFCGPKKDAGQIEWDKAWSREFMKEQGIPHPAFYVFSSKEEAFEFLETETDQPWVVKASGLAEGKGVILTNTAAEAKEAIHEMDRFGNAGTTFLLEQYLQGEEFSTYIVSDGTNWKVIGSAQDHKRVNDGDEGPNTGGMGCSTPPLLLTPEIMKKVEEKIIAPTIAGMKSIGRPYTGILYLGGMVLNNGEVSVIEFNARWGDPEAQVILPGLKSDLFEMSMAVALKNITKVKIEMDTKSRVVVAGTSQGYPTDYSAVKGKEVFGLKEAANTPGVKLFGAGVKRVNGKDTANGGRLFYIVGEGKNVVDAREKAYEAMKKVSIEGDNLHYRTDIGWRDVERVDTK